MRAKRMVENHTYSYLVTSMLVTRPKMASHVASTTPTALIARLQLGAYSILPLTCCHDLKTKTALQVPQSSDTVLDSGPL